VDAEEEALKPKKSFADLLILKDIGLTIKQGEFVCILGDVGSGKSSFLMSIVGDLLYTNPEFA
jgi:ABC-type Fe3+/spermidine/putrescine transport system ATPase subunit